MQPEGREWSEAISRINSDTRRWAVVGVAVVALLVVAFLLVDRVVFGTQEVACSVDHDRVAHAQRRFGLNWFGNCHAGRRNLLRLDEGQRVVRYSYNTSWVMQISVDDYSGQGNYSLSIGGSNVFINGLSKLVITRSGSVTIDQGGSHAHVDAMASFVSPATAGPPTPSSGTIHLVADVYC